MKNIDQTVLEKIVREKANELSTYKARENLADVKIKASHQKLALNLTEFLDVQKHVEVPKTRIIAEIKKASPSAGLLRKNFEPKKIAQIYQEAGACALSILTDVAFFQGSLDHLSQVREVFSRPILRKDFMIDPYQIYQARAYGADCILAIVALLEKSELQDFCGLASELGMHTLVEVHNHEELQEALSALKNQHSNLVFGINNRNLKTLKMDLSISEKLRPFVPENIPLICESGISTRKQIEHFEALGFSGFLIGEHLLKSENIHQNISQLMGM